MATATKGKGAAKPKRPKESPAAKADRLHGLMIGWGKLAADISKLIRDTPEKFLHRGDAMDRLVEAEYAVADTLARIVQDYTAAAVAASNA